MSLSVIRLICPLRTCITQQSSNQWRHQYLSPVVEKYFTNAKMRRVGLYVVSGIKICFISLEHRLFPPWEISCSGYVGLSHSVSAQAHPRVPASTGKDTLRHISKIVLYRWMFHHELTLSAVRPTTWKHVNVHENGVGRHGIPLCGVWGKGFEPLMNRGIQPWICYGGQKKGLAPVGSEAKPPEAGDKC